MRAPGCKKHKHPALRSPISEAAFMREFHRIYDRAVYGAIFRGRRPELATVEDIKLSRSLGREHERNARRYGATVMMDEGVIFEFAPQILWLPKRNRRGVIAHEIGHALLYHKSNHSEDEADQAAYWALGGLTINYDLRWPGKGLQTANNVD